MGGKERRFARGSSGLSLGERMVPSCTRKALWSRSAVDAPLYVAAGLWLRSVRGHSRSVSLQLEA